MDIAELERLARAATPGPWRVGIPGNFTVYAPDGLGELSGPIFGKTCGPRAPENRAYIAAAHPQAILRLCEEMREMREAVAPFVKFALHGIHGGPLCSVRGIYEDGTDEESARHKGSLDPDDFKRLRSLLARAGEEK